MKTLLMMRHAKSSWKDTSLPDTDRPLNDRGRKAAPKMGRLLKRQKFPIDCVICSSAVRARQTAALVIEKLKSPPAVSYRDELYGATPASMAKVLSETDEGIGCVLLIGHNPELEEFLAQLTGAAHEFPTAAVAQLELDISDWKSFTEQTPARLVELWRPRDLEADYNA